MKKVEPWKVGTFVGALVVIAILISSAYDYLIGGLSQRFTSSTYREPTEMIRIPVQSAPEREQQVTTREPAVRVKTPEELAAEHASYLARYLSSGFARKPSSETVAVAVVNQDGKPDGTIANALARRFTSEKVKTSATVFTPEFISDGLFREAFGGSSGVINNLELKSFLGALLLAQQTVEYSTNASLENVITAKMGLEVIALSISPSGENQTWSFTANGAGFSPREARALAEERLLKQIATDTKMSVNRFLPSQRNQ